MINFDIVMNTKRDDIAVCQIIKKRHYIQDNGYEWFVDVCIDFVTSHILTLTQNPEPATDMDIARQFLAHNITEEELSLRQNESWEKYREFRKNNEMKKFNG